VIGYFEAGALVRCPRCGEDHLARVPGLGLFDAEECWLGPTWTPKMGSHYGIVALMWRPHRCKGVTALPARVPPPTESVERVAA
jgi:hypothetical protein